MAELGHVVFYVSDLERSVSFYEKVVGLSVSGRIFGDRAAVMTGGRTHHELLLIEVGHVEGPMSGKRLGLYHVGWKIGDSLAELKARYRLLQEMNYPVEGMSDHMVSQSLYLRDPDGNEIELYVDDPKIDWRTDHRWLDAPVKPLKL